MSNQTLDEKKLEVKHKIHHFKENAKRKVKETYYWVIDNKEFLMVVVPAGAAVLGSGFKLCKSISRNVALKQEQHIKDTRIYDRSLGRYIELKRPLRNKDMEIILNRKDNGERLSNILFDMGLTK